METIFKMKDYNCKICKKPITGKTSYIASHVKRCHGISLEKYAENYYSEINSKDKRNCISCNSYIPPKIFFNFSKGEFEKSYDGYLCPSGRNSPSIECKNNISQMILGSSYNKKTYEFIGSKKEFLSLKYQIPESESVILKNVNLKKIKRLNPRISEEKIEKIYKEKIRSRNSKPTNNLSGFIKRHGEIEGRKLYNENCKKIGYSNTLEYYIEKYGEELGKDKWKIRNSYNTKKLGSSVSKSSEEFSLKFIKSNINFIKEYPIIIGKNGIVVDFFLPEYGIIIEFFGDYWHCNPKIYDNDYYHKILKMTASQKWENDKNRIDKILEDKKNSVLVVWESTNISSDEILSLVNSIKNKNTLFII
jgi:hypothetical protein